MKVNKSYSDTKKMIVVLPDISSKAFWSGPVKAETFHPEVYKRWVKEEIKRAAIIADINIEIKG